MDIILVIIGLVTVGVVFFEGIEFTRDNRKETIYFLKGDVQSFPVTGNVNGWRYERETR